MSNFNGFTGDNDPVYYSRKTENTDGPLTNEDARQVDELTMWVKRLAHSLKNANPDSKLPYAAMEYLTAKGLVSVGDALR